MKKAAGCLEAENLRGSALATLCCELCQIATMAGDIQSAQAYSKIALRHFVLGTGRFSLFSKRMTEINDALQSRTRVDMQLFFKILNTPDNESRELTEEEKVFATALMNAIWSQNRLPT